MTRPRSRCQAEGMRRAVALLSVLVAAAVVAAPSSIATAARRPLVGASVSAAATPISGPVGPLGHDGRWLVDTTGRVVTLHGVNEVAKSAPYYPASIGFSNDDATFLVQHGFSAVRLGVVWEGLGVTRCDLVVVHRPHRRDRESARRAPHLRAARLPPGWLGSGGARQRARPRAGHDHRRSAEPAGRVPAVLRREPGAAARVRELLEEPFRRPTVSACRTITSPRRVRSPRAWRTSRT